MAFAGLRPLVMAGQEPYEDAQIASSPEKGPEEAAAMAS